jgi:enoyl-CoA hydratase
MTVEVEQVGRVLVATIRREEKRNALNADITAGVDAAMNRLEDDPELWCGILTGGTSVFSAGADLAAGVGEPTPRGGLVGLIRRQRTKPLVAAVEGLVVAASTAAFGLPEVKRGLMPDFGGAFRSARMLPPNVARELLLTGDNLPAERAERLGFVNLVTEPGGALAGALALAERICANAPLATREALGVVNHVVAGDEDELWKRSDAAHERLLGSADVREGIAAFFERRRPNWQAR